MNPIFFTVDENDIKFLRQQWNDLLSSSITELSVQENVFQFLKEKYSEESRLYHNLSHVKDLLHLFQSFRNKISDPHAVQFAIWFHDVVYDTRRNDNEEKSARLASQLLPRLHVDTKTVEFVHQWILATRHHNGDLLSEDARLFLDMDLAILGAGEEIYKKYSRAIREEYFWVPEPTYRSGRRTILERFIHRERIYVTDEMQQRFEEQARRNLRSEIQSLGTS